MKKPAVVRESITSYRVEKERLNLYLPKDLVEDLRRYVPARARTQFVIDALDRELHRIRLKEALKASYGAWKDEDPAARNASAILLVGHRSGQDRCHS